MKESTGRVMDRLRQTRIIIDRYDTGDQARLYREEMLEHIRGRMVAEADRDDAREQERRLQEALDKQTAVSDSLAEAIARMETLFGMSLVSNGPGTGGMVRCAKCSRQYPEREIFGHLFSCVGPAGMRQMGGVPRAFVEAEENRQRYEALRQRVRQIFHEVDRALDPPKGTKARTMRGRLEEIRLGLASALHGGDPRIGPTL